MRLKYYKRAIGQIKHKKQIALLFLSLFLFGSVLVYFVKDVIPTVKTLCENKAIAIAVTITNETIQKYMVDVNYNDIVNLTYDNNGNLIAMTANTSKMNKLSAGIIYEIQQTLSSLETTSVKIPLGKLFGLSMFSGYGPSISVKILPAGNVKAEFTTNFSAEGINQTKHAVNINVETYITIVAPFTSDTMVSKNTIKVAETVLIGNIPDTYYNIEGIQDFDKSDVTEFMN